MSYGGSSGLYFACHDPYGSFRRLRAKRTSDNSVKLSMEQSVPDMTVPGNGYESEYDSVWRIYNGDWFDAAHIYRDWAAKESKWFNRKGQSRTPATPDDIVELSAWAQGGGSAEECVDITLKFKEYMGVPTGFHWYLWHANPFDNDYPHYFPERPGMVEGVKKLQAAGVYAMPYINGRLWDNRDKGFEDWQWSSVAKPYTVKNEDGSFYIEGYGSKESDGSDVVFSVMCPSTSMWQQKVVDIVLRLMNEDGVTGVYLDQVAAHPPEPVWIRSMVIRWVADTGGLRVTGN